MKILNYLTHTFSILSIQFFLLAKVYAQYSTTEATGNNVLIPTCTASPSRAHPSDSTITSISGITHIGYDSDREPITLELQVGSSKSLQCDMGKTEERSVSWKLESDTEILEPRNFYDVSSGSSARHQHSYFTQTGHFYDKVTGNYYKPDEDYCVESISDERINIRVCVANEDCSSTSTPNTYCLPKCCALDETLLFWKRQCVRLPEAHGRTPWKPSIYEGPQNPHKMVQSNPRIIYHMAQLPKNCELVEINETHTESVYRWSSATYVPHPSYDELSQENDDVKLILPKDGSNYGKIRLMYFYHTSRKWIVENYDNFCVEGFYVKSKYGSGRDTIGNPDNFVIFYCPNEGGGDGENEEVEHQMWKTWMYVATAVLSLLFLLATIFVYLILWDKLNLHGLTILSYTGATFWSYFFFAIAHFISLFPNQEITGVHDRGWVCYSIAILTHYFFLSSYFWLTCMNFDLWITFQSNRVTKRDSKEWPKYTAYAVISFALPAALIVAFVVIDVVYRDPFTEVPVPDYAMGTCFVSPDFRGEYVYTPMAILLAINILLICMTMWIFIRARTKSTAVFNNTKGKDNLNQYNAKLFAKIFVVMGGASIVDILTWYYNNKGHKPWPIVVLEVISYFSPIALFFLFCLNEKIVGQLRKKFPGFTALKMFENKRDIDRDHSYGKSSQTNMHSLDSMGNDTEAEKSFANT